MITKGEYVMPNFRPEIKDLISKMLVVDPEKRITINEIMKHPAFHLYLPSTYIVPSPIPLPPLTDPIEPDTIKSETYNTLRKIGYETDDELNIDLESNERTMAKVFNYLMTDSGNFDVLPWDIAKNHDILLNPDDQIEQTEFNFIVDKPINLPADPFHRHVHKNVFRPQSIYSIARKIDWGIKEREAIIYEQEDSIGICDLKPPEVMSKIQKVLDQFQCLWFHPDDLRLVSKMSDDTYMTFDLMYNEGNDLILLIHMNQGTPEQFQEISLTVREAINE